MSPAIINKKEYGHGMVGVHLAYQHSRGRGNGVIVSSSSTWDKQDFFLFK